MKNLKKFNFKDEVPDYRNEKIEEKDYYFKDQLLDEIQGILIPSNIYQERINQLGKLIRDDYHDKNPIFLFILKGSAKLPNELFGNLSYDDFFEHEQLFISSKSTTGINTGKANYSNNLNNIITKLNDRYLVIFEDIVDTGGTINGIISKIEEQNIKPKDISIFSATCKIDEIKEDFDDSKLRYIGFIIGNEWVVGRGLDLNQKYRDLPDICILTEKTKEKYKN
jgi:hypoxanthine phosphoribosyltransferase